MAGLVMNFTLISFLFPFRPKPIIVKLWWLLTPSHPRSAPPSMSDAFADFLLGLFRSGFSAAIFPDAFNLLVYGVLPFGDHVHGLNVEI